MKETSPPVPVPPAGEVILVRELLALYVAVVVLPAASTLVRRLSWPSKVPVTALPFGSVTEVTCLAVL